MPTAIGAVEDCFYQVRKVNDVTIIRVGTTKKYSEGWESAFSKGKKKATPAPAAKKSAKKASAVKKAPAKATPAKSTKKKSSAKKGKK